MKNRLYKLSAGGGFAFMSSRFVTTALLLTLWAWGAHAQPAAVGGYPNGGSHWHKRACYWAARSPGMVLAALPAGFVQVSVGGTGYYYYDGVYFRPVASLSSGYEVVAPPTGVVVPQIPTDAELVTVGDGVYYYAGGAFYVQQPAGFAVVPAPPGAVVKTPPPGATPIALNGAVYFQTADAYYQPIAAGGMTLYTTVRL
jgi:hypothetical protein